ncbi:SDR family oxidoreductase [Bacillus solimangrovi]|uniref:3-beta hydroxysteroid dehydrogenase n=1 Tax=Bacillus solimangrovi TaxID=1305675 RepID=A0A1E5LFV3_9BACI|nr:SDR family oxidoreductase [Bacillus solimangrovi]OEH92951.1 3-beta hydroxysteroid dehydrogenase [Bacillus solimangrovi]
MKNNYFFTGFPGFITSSLLKELVKEEHQINHIYLLVLPQTLKQAEESLHNIPIESSKLTILTGDITKKDLNIASELMPILQESITHVFHLAAIYDIAVPKSLAEKINVHGTKMVNDWVQTLNNLKRYVYFSTAYVSGRREGNILETDLDEGQTFKNHYEQTKFVAEIEVQKIVSKVPTTIIRPGIVKGHSKTGATIKFDGPYFMLNMFEALKASPYIPYFGSGRVEGNFVPVDYVISATIYLAHVDKAIGQTYHLTDPSPYPMREVYRMLMKEYLNQSPKATVPLSVAKSFLIIPPLRKRLKIEREGLDYFTCKSHYDTTNAVRDLEGSGIQCPDFKETVAKMVEYYRIHKDDETKHIQIK